ncbi:MAG: right-handed parallel beta-helix repeat-containing protein, partial [Kiritimatiellaeota bacterium]|nr:right-handed parallel beta-helix repeat-containing protein [Kiritimatiellota bacterium]
MKKGLTMMVAGIALCVTQANGWGDGGADVVHVRAGAVGGNDGSDWANAFATLEDALAALGGGRTNVWIAGGEYALTENAVVEGDYCILGGFAGTESSPGERIVDATGRAVNPTVIRGVYFNGSANEYFSVSLSADTGMLDNVTFTGFAVVNAFNLAVTGDFALSHFTFTNNTVHGGGGRFVNLNGVGHITMAHCAVSDNVSHFWDLGDFCIQVGGGTSLSVFDSEISRNRGNTPWNARGARNFGISFFGSTLLIERTRFSGNEICTHNAQGGAALHLQGSVGATIRNCLFDGNKVTWWRSEGNRQGYGVVCVYMGGVLIENCTFAGNLTESLMDNDAAIVQRGGSLTLRNNIFWDNAWLSAATQDADLYVAAGATAFGYNSFASPA